MLSSNRRVASSLVSDFVTAFKRRSISACSSRRASARCRVADAWSLEALVAPERASWASASCQLHQYCWQSKEEGAAQPGDVPVFAGALAGRGGWRVRSRDSRSRQRPGFCHSGSLRPLYARATAAKAERSSWLAAERRLGELAETGRLRLRTARDAKPVRSVWSTSNTVNTLVYVFATNNSTICIFKWPDMGTKELIPSLRLRDSWSGYPSAKSTTTNTRPRPMHCRKPPKYTS
jgi:hypothetical protein